MDEKDKEVDPTAQDEIRPEQEQPMEQAGTDQPESAEDKKQKKSFGYKGRDHKKIKELEDKLAATEKELSQLKDQFLRKLAEFENYKRRTEKEFLAHLEYANEELIVQLLPVIDDFERFLSHADKAENQQALREGVDLIYKKLGSLLDKKGLKLLESVGQEFDTEKHTALMQMESDKYESGVIIDEYLKGYTLNNKVIRHAQVIVAK
jgi:molecular chaperone GrpE